MSILLLANDVDGCRVKMSWLVENDGTLSAVAFDTVAVVIDLAIIAS